MKTSKHVFFFIPILFMSVLILILTFLIPTWAAPSIHPVLVPGDPIPDPPPNALNRPPTSTVSITYDEAISPTTVTTRTFAVYAMQTGLLTGTYNVNVGTISLLPSQPFKPGELVYASATTGTLNLVGQGPISPTIWQFQTAVARSTGILISSGQSLTPRVTSEVNLGDLDGDGDLDAFVANLFDSDVIWLNDGNGMFVENGQNLGYSDSEGLALGDLDGDGDLDALVAIGWGYVPNKVWLNDGLGSFFSSQDLGGLDSKSVALGDLDGDGDLDAFVGNCCSQPNTIWLNDGGIQDGTPGHLTDSGQYLGSLWSESLALGDLDGDSDLDAFVCNGVWNAEPEKVWLNDGSGGFVDSGQNLGSAGCLAVVLGDIDNDGDLDALTGNWTDAGNKVWLNDGAGGFVDSGQNLDTTASATASLGDLDGDGDLDAFVANQIWLNDGQGAFVYSGQYLDNPTNDHLALGDLDGDGDLDAFAGNGYPDPQPNYVWLNQNGDDLQIIKSITPIGILMPGNAITYTLIYTNNGPVVATGITITDIMPEPVTDLDVTSNMVITPIGELNYSWQVANLAPRASGVITISSIISPEITAEFAFTNTASITSTVLEVAPANNTSSVTSEINVAPTADAGGPYDVDEGSSTGLNASGSFDPGNDIVAYEWDLNDDGFYDDAIGITTTFTAVDDGVHTIGLQVTDVDGAKDTDTASITTNNVAPSVDAGPDQVVRRTDAVTLPPATFIDPGPDDTHTATIDWGDGTVEAGTVDQAAKTISGSHVYADAGDYIVIVTVTDDDGGQGSDTIAVTTRYRFYLPIVQK